MLEPRNLKAAYLKYCGGEMEITHTAEGDAKAAAEILDGQLENHPDLPRDVKGLCAMCIPENYVDPEGKFIWSNDEAVCNFGKYSGRTLKDISAEHPDYLHWIIGKDFATEVKEIAGKALLGDFPKLL